MEYCDRKLMNLVFALVTLILLLCVLPFYLLHRFLYSVIRCMYPEDVAGKVVLITGASSGIGEYLAYEYAKRRARLVLAARRADRLKDVCDRARSLGSPDVMVVPTDVSSLDGSMNLIRDAVDRFGRLDHLVNNAGVSGELALFDEIQSISDYTAVMNINFWGAVYSTKFAIPHLKRSKGKIIVIASVNEWFCSPRTSIYNATKAAVVSFYETLRNEYYSDIGITIVTPGPVESEMTDTKMRKKMHMDFMPFESTEWCAKAIVESACRGDEYLSVPSWVRIGFLAKLLCPNILTWITNFVFIAAPKAFRKD